MCSITSPLTGGDTVNEWLTKYSKVTFHFTPTGSSWLNQVKIWFGVITKQSIRRGTFTSVQRLIDAINDYITHWNQTQSPLLGPPRQMRSSPKFD
ncbi:MAG: transposase [Pseudonocardia sp.]|nr:transposase [Pseudonocardia sp.]